MARPKDDNELTPSQMMSSQIVYNEGKAIELLRECYGAETAMRSLQRADFWALHLTVIKMEKRVNQLADMVADMVYVFKELNQLLKERKD
jgi:hypothetical protein